MTGKHLLIGAEGSLGIVTAAALKLFPMVRDEAHAVCAVAEPAAAVQLFCKLRDHFDTSVHACELLSDTQINLALEHVEGLRFPWQDIPKWVVMIALGDADPGAGLEGRLATFMETLLGDGTVTDAVMPKNVGEAKAFRNLRHSLSEANKRAGHGIVFDVAVRISHVPAFIKEAYAAAAQIAPMATPLIVSHLGDGNVHFIVMCRRDLGDFPGGIADLTKRLFKAVHDLAEAFGGSFSAEHGIGRKLAAELAERLDPAELGLMHAIKAAIDPQTQMAPGVMLAPLVFKEEASSSSRASPHGAVFPPGLMMTY